MKPMSLYNTRVKLEPGDWYSFDNNRRLVIKSGDDYYISINPIKDFNLGMEVYVNSIGKDPKPDIDKWYVNQPYSN